MQEDIENRTVALSVSMTKVTAMGLARTLALACREIQKANHYAKAKHPQGRQSVKSLMKHGIATNTLPIDGETHLFDKVARKWNVDYAFTKVGHNKYLLLFKSGQADAITACFSEYTKLCMKRAKNKRPRIYEQLRKSGEQVREKSKELERIRETAHDER